MRKSDAAQLQSAGPSGAVEASASSFRGGPPPGAVLLGAQPAAAAAGSPSPSGAAGSSGGAPLAGCAGGPLSPVYTHALPAVPPAVAATTLEPFPELPAPAAEHAATAHPHPHHHHSSGPDPLAGARPEGLDAGIWERFTAYRAERQVLEASGRAAADDLAQARRDLPELEAREAALGSEMDGLMASISQLRSERRVAAYDADLQLRMRAGQVEVSPPQPAAADLPDARLLGRSVVESLNAVVLGKGAKKVRHGAVALQPGRSLLRPPASPPERCLT
jgi:hypothetical protein